MRLLASFVVVTQISFLIFSPIFTFAQEVITKEERAELEKKLVELEAEIEQHEAKIAEYQKQGKTLQGEISSLNSQIDKLNLKIKAINLQLASLDNDIEENKGEIKTTEDRLENTRRALANLIQNLYENSQVGLVEILLRNPRLSDFFGSVNNILSVQDNLSITVTQITELRGELLNKKENLAIQRNDVAALRARQSAAKASVQSVKETKNQILVETKGQEAKFQDLLQETKKTAAEIRKRIFQIVGGGELNFQEAYEIARLAEKTTGIRAAMILAILDRESNLGQNVGRCSYEEAMHPNRDLPVFLGILEELKAVGKAPPEPVLVSCPITSHGAYGGAMGPAQFIPSTWNLYKARIADITGNTPANPWNNSDAFIGTALYLRDAYNSQSCRDYGVEGNASYPELSIQFLRERCAAAKYYAGGRWYTYRFFYGDPVVERANKFQNDIDILNS
ncbi:MAG: lytic murein transglycosylase [Candidatus Harrisonbacteria bacterium]|nr:lytic murein transglycosylase [Candidatus Harrisonbacteria bacterium]